MKRAVGYARISREEQSHFSISGQVEQMEDYAIKNGYELVKVFVDDGQSAKNFNRKSWKQLEAFLNQHYKSIDYLFVYKYDRFSRNVHESLEVIHKLEEIFKIRIISICEPIGLPPESPFYFQLRTQMLLQAHVERLVIGSRTKFGMDKAKREGRYLGTAPFGYVNARDDRNMPCIEVDRDRALIVEKIFHWYSIGITAAEIKRKAKEIGFTLQGKDSVYRVLKNPVYAGMLNAPDDEGFIEGIHEPVITRELFLAVQEKLKRPGLPQRKYNDEAYLKSAIHCDVCQRALTSGRSKGRNQYYWYYECTAHRKSFNMQKAHDIFDQILDEITFTQDQVDYVEESLRRMLENHIKETEGKLPVLTQKRAELYLKKENLEDKYLSGKLDDNTFAQWSVKIKAEIKDLDHRIEVLTSSNNAYWTRFASQIENLKSIKTVFHMADTPQKFVFVENGFGNSLSYNGDLYRTAFLNPIFSHKALILRRKGLLELHKKKGIHDESPLGVNDGSRTHDLRNHNPAL